MNLQLFRTNGKRRSKPFLLLEISMLHTRLYLVEAAKHPIGTTLLREERPAPGEGMNPMQIVRTILDTDAEVRDLAVVINTPAIHHRLISIPLMKKEERQRVLHFEVKQFSTLEEQGKISFWSAGKIKEQDMMREQVLCAELNQSIVDGLVEAARERNFQLIGFTSYAQMASHLVRECPLDGSRNVALLEVGDHEGSITLFHADVWNMDRHFLLAGMGQEEDSSALAELDAEKLKLEVGRALQYFKQQVRNENIDKIFLFGTARHVEDIKRLLETSFRITVIPVIRDKKRFMPDSFAEEAKESYPLFQIVHAAALYSSFDRYINFLPPTLHLEKHARLRKLALAGCAVSSYLLMGAAAILVHREAFLLPPSFSAGSSLPLMQGNSHVSVQQLQQDRTFILASQKSDDWLKERHYLLAELFRELAYDAPPQMRITGLTVTGKNNGWQVQVNAEIRSANGYQSQQLLLKFQDQIRTLACMKQLTWGDVRVTDTESAVVSSRIPHEQNNILTFTMRGLLKQETFSGKPKPSFSAHASGL